MPAIRLFIVENFEMEPLFSIDPDLVVVMGAAIQAALIDKDKGVKDTVVTDVLSHSLGVDVSKRYGNKDIHGYFSPIIDRADFVRSLQSSVISHQLFCKCK